MVGLLLDGWACRCKDFRDGGRQIIAFLTPGDVIGGGEAANEWNLVMAAAMLAMIPPAIVVLVMQRWFVKGLVDAEK